MVIGYAKHEPKFKDGWGETIKDIREHRGFSAQQVADEVGVSKSTLLRWEREMMVPELRAAKKLVDILKVDLDTIFRI